MSAAPLFPPRLVCRGRVLTPPRACVARAVKKAQQVGLKVKELQDELQETEIEAVGADGGVTVVISGAQVALAPLPPI